ncbi:MAG: leucine-rich repeat protein, partial [Ruminococcus sp.]|nr:leucine-rich repeat protein [Ruminococcus sp.]
MKLNKLLSAAAAVITAFSAVSVFPAGAEGLQGAEEVLSDGAFEYDLIDGCYTIKRCTASIVTEIPASRNGVTINAIGDNAFANCKALEDVTINGSNDIGNYVFSGCSALKNINIDLDEKFNGNNLYRCSSLETINNTDPFNADGSPKPEFLGFIKRNMNNVDDNPLINKYVTYCVKETAKDIIRDSMTDMEKVKAIHD